MAKMAVRIPLPMHLLFGGRGCAECGKVCLTERGYRRHWVRRHSNVQWWQL